MDEYSLEKLLSEYNIVFPVIQRDYAQGRKSAHATEVRVNFVEVLCNSLINGNEMHLDFVYGTIKDDKINHNKKSFIPLDGQQRLTTLFLLHWYVFYRVDRLSAFNNVLFSYETRDSSKEFCECLIRGEVSTERQKEKISDVIRDQNWFMAIWEEDPTVRGMLTMLDAIEDCFNRKGENDFEEISSKLSYIKFYMLSLGDNFPLADDLYVKMNARGLGLTNFENFKACFIKYLNEKKVEGRYVFIKNIDTKWTNIFWHTLNTANQEKKDSNGKKKGKIIGSADKEMMRFIRMILSFCYAMRNDGDNKNGDENNEHEYISQNFYSLLVNAKGKVAIPEEQLTYFKLKELDALDINSASFIIHAFKNLGSLFNDEGSKWIDSHLMIKNHFVNIKQEWGKFVGSEKPEYDNQLMIFAIILCCDFKSDGNLEEQWLRLIRNLICNTITDSQDKMRDAIVSMNKLFNGYKDAIYKNDFNTLFEKNYFNSQGKEEIEKYNIFRQYPFLPKLIFDIENIPYLQGRIGCILSWSKENEQINEKTFRKIGNHLIELFRRHDDIGHDSHYIERLLLSRKSSGGKYVYPYRYEDFKVPERNLQDVNGITKIQQYSFANLKDDRDYSWKRLLNDNPSDYIKESTRSKSLKECQELFKGLLEEAPNNWKAQEQNDMEDWRKELLIHPCKMNYCEKSIMYIADSKTVYLSKGGVGKFFYKRSETKLL